MFLFVSGLPLFDNRFQNKTGKPLNSTTMYMVLSDVLRFRHVLLQLGCDSLHDDDIFIFLRILGPQHIISLFQEFFRVLFWKLDLTDTPLCVQLEYKEWLYAPRHIKYFMILGI